MKAKLNMFTTKNDTDKWAVMVDGYFQLFETSEDAEKVYSLIGDDIAESPFGSSAILPPNFTPVSFKNEDMTTTRISEGVEIDVENYIERNFEKRKYYGSLENVLGEKTATERLDNARKFSIFSTVSAVKSARLSF